MKRSITAACFLGLFLAPLAHAHYPWFVILPKGGKAGTLRLYFEGGPSPGDGQHPRHRQLPSRLVA